MEATARARALVTQLGETLFKASSQGKSPRAVLDPSTISAFGGDKELRCLDEIYGGSDPHTRHRISRTISTGLSQPLAWPLC